MNKILKTKILLLFSLLLLTTSNVAAESSNRFDKIGGNNLSFQITQKQVTISMKDASLRAILKEVQKQSGISILYKDAEIDAIGKKNVTVKNLSVEEALKTILTGTNLDYKVIGNSISIFTKKTIGESANQKITISGKVIDVTQKTVAGATVTVAGTTRGAITDGDGNFSFSGFSNDVLEIAFTGKKTTTYKNLAQKSKDLLIELLDDAMAVDDVVVTGYQTLEKKMNVGSTMTLKGEDLQLQNGASIDKALQGRTPGMIVSNTSSRAGTSPKIQIRGTTTLIGNQDPLWVVDGVIQDDPINIDPNNMMSPDMRDLKEMVGSQISWLNPMDIDKITILKDASATAIYGSKASNGVIVVTTKIGKPGRMSVSYSGNMTVNSKPNYGQFNMMNSNERTAFVDEVFNAGNKYSKYPVAQLKTYDGTKLLYAKGEIDEATLIARRERLSTVNTDWFDLLTRTGISQNHNISLSGGTEKIVYNASMGYTDTKGQEIGNSSETMTGRISLNITPHSKIKINVSLNGTSTQNNGFTIVNPLEYATKTSRNIEAYDEDGNLSYYKKRSKYQYNNEPIDLNYNILHERDNTSAEMNMKRISAAITLNWKILSWLDYNFSGGYTSNTNISEQVMGERTYAAALKYRGYDYGTENGTTDLYKAAWYPLGGKLITSNGAQTSYNLQNKFLFNKTFNDGNHRFNAMLAYEIRSAESLTLTSSRAGYVPDRGDRFTDPTLYRDFVPMNGAAMPLYGMPIDMETSRYRLVSNFMSVFATATYMIKSRYVFNATVRNDFSNKFGQDVNRRLDPTYSFGVSWRACEEKFIRNSEKWVSDLTFKATFGIQGNAPTVSPELVLKRNGNMNFINQFFSTIESIPNPNLSWERTKTWNFSTEFTLFDMFSTIVEYYTRSSNAILTQKLSPEYGVPTMQMNGGMIHNNGIEVSVSFNPVNTKNFGINLSLNSSKNWNSLGKVTTRPKWADHLTGNTSLMLQEGYPLGSMWSYEYAGLSPYNGIPMFNNLTLRPGDLQNLDLNPLPYLVYSGTSVPNFTGGLTLGVRYKSLTLGTNFSLILGRTKRLPSPYKVFGTEFYVIPDVETNLSKDLANRWKKPGDELTTNFPALVTTSGQASIPVPYSTSAGNAYNLWEYSTAMTVKSSFLRCQQIKLSWRMRETMATKLGIKSFSVTGSVLNPFVIASKRFNGFDPELNDSVMPKEYSIGLSIGF